MRLTAFRLAFVLCTWLLASCGGGGGGGDTDMGGSTTSTESAADPAPSEPSVRVTFSETPLKLSFNHNQFKSSSDPVSAFVQATVVGPLDRVTHVFVLDSGLGFGGSASGGSAVPIFAWGDNRYAVSLWPNDQLAPGTYMGTLSVVFCKDSACSEKVPVAGGVLPYELTVKPQLNAALYVDGALVSSFTSGSQRFSFSARPGMVLEIRGNMPMLVSANFRLVSVDESTMRTERWVARVTLPTDGSLLSTYVTVATLDERQPQIPITLEMQVTP